MSQSVAEPHQAFMGSLLIDERFRRAPAVHMGLFEIYIKEVAARRYREIVVELLPSNKQSLYLLKKYGFILYEGVNIFGYGIMHHYFGALMNFLGTMETAGEISMVDIFKILPPINKEKALDQHEIINGRYIESRYIYEGKDALVLIDIKNVTVVGLEYEGYKFYPCESGYVFENHTISSMHVEQRFQTCGSAPQYTSHQILPMEKKILPADGRDFALNIQGRIFYIKNFPERQISGGRLSFGMGRLSISFDAATGFADLTDAGGERLMRLMWPCAEPPYVEGALIPRIKNLRMVQAGDYVTLIEEADGYILTRIFHLTGSSVELSTRLRFTRFGARPEPISHIWIDDADYELTMINEQGEYLHRLADYPPDETLIEDMCFWCRDKAAPDAAPFKRIRINAKRWAAELEFATLYKNTVLSDPYVGFYLNFDAANIYEEQIVEQLTFYIS
jgi:hypothetical protein